MNNIKNKILLGSLVLLLVLNTITIAMFLLEKNKKAHPPIEDAKTYLIRELNFDEYQQTKLQELIDEHRIKVDSIRAMIKKEKEKLFSLISEQSVTDSVKNAFAINASTSIVQLDLQTLAHFENIKKICNTNQQLKFKSIIKKFSELYGRPNHPQHAPPPHRERDFGPDDKNHPHDGRPPRPEQE